MILRVSEPEFDLFFTSCLVSCITKQIFLQSTQVHQINLPSLRKQTKIKIKCS
jgi:hypothetical protein